MEPGGSFLDMTINTKQFLAPMAEVEPHGACLTHAATDMGPSLCSKPRLLGHSFLCSRCWLRANTLNTEQAQYLGLQREIFLQVLQFNSFDAQIVTTVLLSG